SIDADFARRIYIYNYQICDRYDRPVVSLAVLGDASPKWRSRRYEQRLERRACRSWRAGPSASWRYSGSKTFLDHRRPAEDTGMSRHQPCPSWQRLQNFSGHEQRRKGATAPEQASETQ